MELLILIPSALSLFLGGIVTGMLIQRHYDSKLMDSERKYALLMRKATEETLNKLSESIKDEEQEIKKEQKRTGVYAPVLFFSHFMQKKNTEITIKLESEVVINE